MKQIDLTGVVLNPAARTLDFSGVGVDPRTVLAVLHEPTNQFIFAAGRSDRGYASIAGAVMTLAFDTSALAVGPITGFRDDGVDVATDARLEACRALIATGNATLSNLYTGLGTPSDTATGSDAAPGSLIAKVTRLLGTQTGIATVLAAIRDRLPSAPVGGRLAVDGSGVVQPVSGSAAVGQAPAVPPVPVSGVDGSGLKRHILLDALGRMMLGANAPRTTATGPLGAANAAVTVPVDGMNTAVLQLAGTWAGTVSFLGSIDGGATYFPVNMIPFSGGAGAAAVGSVTANGAWEMACGGLTHLQAVMTAYASGSAIATLGAANGQKSVRVGNPAGNPLTVTGTLAQGAAGASPWPVSWSGQSVGVTSLPAIPAGSAVIGAVTQSGGPWSVSGTVAATQSGPWSVTLAAGSAAIGSVTVSNLPATQPVSGAVTANIGVTNGLALDASVQAVKTALGSPFQAGGSIGNTAFGITGQLPAFAATPTFNLGTLNGAATAAAQATGNGSLATIAANTTGAALDGADPASPAVVNAGIGIRGWLATIAGLLKLGPAAKAASSSMTVATDLANLEPAGAAITGAAMPAGGAGLTGWLSAIWQACAAALPAGTSIIGRVGIDQTTQGTTNGIWQINGSAPLLDYAGSIAASGQGVGTTRDGGPSPMPWTKYAAFFLPSQTGTASVQMSADGNAWTTVAQQSVAAGSPTIIPVPMVMRYARWTFTNGATAGTLTASHALLAN